MSRVRLRVMGGTTYFEPRINADENGFVVNWRQRPIGNTMSYPLSLQQAVGFTLWLLHRRKSPSRPRTAVVTNSVLDSQRCSAIPLRQLDH